MSIKIRSFGGIAIWWLRKYCSGLTSKISLSAAGRARKPKIDAFIDEFLQAERTPVFKFLMIETVNRCNGKCAFCPANVKAEKRDYKQMPDVLFKKIIDELTEMHWKGSIFLQVNNEPFIDKRILQFAEYIRKELADCRICVITNGTLLNVDKIRQMTELVDELIINDYSEYYRLSPHLKELYRYVRKKAEEFSKMEIVINRRFSGEVLATRAGSAPNKPTKNNRINYSCIYPFTDLIIFPDGKVGMCCNDCYEVTNFGDINESSLYEIWTNDKFRLLRTSMKQGRNDYAFCKECDVVDAGSREKEI